MPDDKLKKLWSTIVYLLWRKKRNSEGGGLVSAEELLAVEELRFELRKTDPAKNTAPEKDTKDSDIKKIQKALRNLERLGYLESGSAEKTHDSKPGPPPKGYRLPEVGKMITWQSTAIIVLRLFNHPHEPVEEETFVLEILELGLNRDDNQQRMTREDVINQIAYAISKGYITLSDELSDVDQPIGRTGVRRLHRTSRIDKEEHLLKMIASAPEKKRMMIAMGLGSSSNASDQADSAAGASQL